MAFDNDDLMDCMTRCKGENQPFAVATVVRTEDSTAGNPGDKAVIRADGTITGWIGGGCAQGAVKKAAFAALADGQPRLIQVRPKDELEDNEAPKGVEMHGSGCPSRGITEVFVEPVLPRARLLIIGTSPVAQTLCDLAKAMNYVVTVAGNADALKAFHNADQTIEGFTIPEDEPDYRYVVVSSQGKRDRDALKAALSTNAQYLAFVGSRRKADKVKADLIEEGQDATQVGSVHSPAGLDIGAVTPDEIALSILADVVRERRLGDADAPKATPIINKPKSVEKTPKASGSCCGGSTP